MGLFGNKQQDQPVYQDDQAQQTHYAAPTPPPQTIDGFIASAAPVPDPTHTGAPVIDEHMHDDEAGSYIMAEPTVTSSDPATLPVQDEPVNVPAPDPLAGPAEKPASAEPEIAEEEKIHETEAGDIPADVPSDTLDDLADIKKQALEQLSPLVNHLDQSPEEKFRTTLMLLQSTDDKKFIKPAYEAAQEITDDKARAQALLEIIKEVDYFTNK